MIAVSVSLSMFINCSIQQSSTEASSSLSDVLPDALRYIYQRCLLEADQELLPAVTQVLH